jgi:hypothetical protein
VIFAFVAPWKQALGRVPAAVNSLISENGFKKGVRDEHKPCGRCKPEDGIARIPCTIFSSLSLQADGFDNGPVAVDVFVFYVIEQPATSTDEHQ